MHIGIETFSIIGVGQKESVSGKKTCWMPAHFWLRSCGPSGACTGMMPIMRWSFTVTGMRGTPSPWKLHPLSLQRPSVSFWKHFPDRPMKTSCPVMRKTLNTDGNCFHRTGIPRNIRSYPTACSQNWHVSQPSSNGRNRKEHSL